jgi:LysR family hydrogen peroxide-inducible transcriptional activator
LELTQVRYFVTLSRSLNFTRAAEVCNVTQPALTRAIQRLEDELGGPLLFRERSLTQLTDLGRSMLPHLEAMLMAAESATALADARRRQPLMSLKIGLGPGIGSAAIAFALREIATILPDLMIRFEETNVATLVEQMLADMLDCALLPDECILPERFNRWPLYDERAIVVLPADHALALCTAVSADHLQNETLLQGDRCGGFAERLGRASGYHLRVRQADAAVAHLLDLVAAGLGVTIISEHTNLPAHLAARPIIEPVLTRQISLAAVAGRPQNPAVAGFIKLCRARRSYGTNHQSPR